MKNVLFWWHILIHKDVGCKTFKCDIKNWGVLLLIEILTHMQCDAIKV